ncbi:MAG TPA: metalloregulator ArsR/SmtB family transcription factor [bacterium]|jgi:ArsR family transcriptional regulator
MSNAAALFKALADDTRLYMLALIRQHRELCVCELESVLGITQSKASRHLRYLLNAGLVMDRREAVWMYYRIAEHLTAAQTAILDNAQLLLDSETLRDLNRKLASRRRLLEGCCVPQEKATVAGMEKAS